MKNKASSINIFGQVFTVSQTIDSDVGIAGLPRFRLKISQLKLPYQKKPFSALISYAEYPNGGIKFHKDKNAEISCFLNGDYYIQVTS